MDIITVPTPVVSAEWLVDHAADIGTSITVLCASMGNPAKSYRGIPGAWLADIDNDFSDPSSDLPHTAPADLQGLFESYGISTDTAVVVYDRWGIMASPRVWWLARAAGLNNVAVLDGGLPAWEAAGGAIGEIRSHASAAPRRGNINTAERDLLTDVRGVERALARSGSAVVDARSAGRFAGVEGEPREGLLGGHIPGSANLPFTQLLQDGMLRPPEQLREEFQRAVGEATQLTTTCGSGVTACILALGATVAGYTEIQVYDGSWSEWGRPDNRHPIAP